MPSRRPVLSIDVRCPICDAGPGQQCVAITYAAAANFTGTHAMRVRSAVAADDKRGPR